MVAEPVKFRLAGGAQPLALVPVQINGAGPFEFILDTGAGTTLVAPHIAQRLNLQTTATKEGQTAGGRVTVALSSVDTLQVGRGRAKNLQVAITDLSHLGRVIGAQPDGDLGYNFLKGFCLTIDYAAGELTIGRSPASSDHASRAETNIVVSNPKKPLILIQVQVNGRGPFQFAIDTGTSTTAISPQLIRALGITATAAPPVHAGAHSVTVSAAQLDRLTVGRAEVRSLPVIAGDFLDMLSGVIGSKLDGIIGYNFLRHFRVVIDYPNDRFRLE